MTGNVLGRRDFLRKAMQGGTLLLAGALDPPIWTRARVRETLRITLAGPSGEGAAGSIGRGVTLGVEEAARTGELMDRAIALISVEAGDVGRAIRDGRVAAVVGAGGDDSAREAAAMADAAGVLFLNAGSRSDALRGAECRRGVFHVEASEAMYAAALAARGDGAADAAAVLWHPSLERFGAGQLNDRYRARFGGEMDGPAWAGWMAVKALWEASLRARSIDPAALRAYLERGATQFDGHKGWPLSFRAWDRQLRQPLYLVAGSTGGGTRVVGEVPERRDEEGSSRDLLDRLGASASATTCATTGEGIR
jgi:ABC-type branched-subunit amino acid transport system substrate-binding protein